ncbi:MAG: peptidylprolyl isomerase [Cyclobacteriaceae bacterium]|nr:peptidylprolyl isomerase [Cyclobacteriaceae bacterium]
MKKIFKEPLVHFLLIGLGFFLLFEMAGDSEEQDSKTVVVNKDVLLKHLQYRSKAFNAEVFEEKLQEMPQEELQRMIDDYIREEVLYREAVAMGMDREDYIIKRRLIQKVEFIAEGVTEAVVELTEEQIQKYFEEYKQDYHIQPFTTFAHIFFELDKRGSAEAEKLAKAELEYLNNYKVSFDKATSRGDRFYYHTNYVEREPDYVASHFGPQMTEAIFEASPSKEQWIGPFPSEYGYHLVMVTKIEPARDPELDEIRARVEDDARRWHLRQKNDEMIQDIIEDYNVKVTYEQG